MKTNSKPKFSNTDEYVSALPEHVRKPLEKLRMTIKKTAPNAEEMISYNIPAFRLNGVGVVYYAAWKTHIGMYPIPGGDQAFKKEISAYAGGKSTAKFPLDKPLPIRLITRFVKFSVKKNQEKAKAKSKKKK